MSRKIALVGLTHPFRGGIAHYTTLLYRALAERHEVAFFSLSRQYPNLLFPGKTQLDESENTLQVPNDPCIDSCNPLSWSKAASKIRAFNPEFAIYSWWHPFFAFSFGGVARGIAKAKIPSIFLCHNVIPHEASKVDRMLLTYAFKAGQGFITHSREDAANLKDIRPEAPLRTNPHPTYDVFAGDAAPDPETARKELGLAGKKVLLFFGYIRKYKGLNVLLEAMEKLPPEEDYHLLIVGEFYDEAAIYATALNRLRGRKQITLVDRYVPNEEVPKYFAAAHLLVAPYLSATQSGVVQIAYGFEKPVVATRVGGIPEAVVDRKTGYLVESQDAAGIAEAVKDYFDQDRAEDMRGHILQEREKYSWDHMVDTIEAVADEIAGGGHA